MSAGKREKKKIEESTLAERNPVTGKITYTNRVTYSDGSREEKPIEIEEKKNRQFEEAGRRSVLSENFRRLRSKPEPTKVVKDNAGENEEEKVKENHQE